MIIVKLLVILENIQTGETIMCKRCDESDKKRNFKGIGLAVLACLSFPSHALRCGTQIVDVGASTQKVEEICNVDSSYQVQNVTADVKKVYMKKDGMNYEMVFVDGELQEIEGNR